MQQQGKCMICQDSSRVVLDHNHVTGKVRGFLCSNCNTMIGMAKESQDTLRIAAGYLKRYEKGDQK